MNFATIVMSLFGQKVRFLQCFMLFLSLTVNYMMRVNLSIALVIMTAPSNTTKVFTWSHQQQSASQSVFFCGYFFMNLAAAVMVTKTSSKLLLLVSASGSAILTLFTPLLVTVGDYYSLIAVRLVLGILQGSLMACTMGLMSRWIPESERGRLGALILGGIHFGNLISFSISGWIGSSYGWQTIFYFSGIVGGIWSILWVILGANSVAECSYITESEKLFIEKENGMTSNDLENAQVPVKKILMSKECWAITLATLGHSWGYWTLVTEMPTYFHNILNLTPTVNGIITAIPYACMWIISFPASYTSDFLIRKGVTTTYTSRKLFNSIGHIGAGVCLAVLSLTTNEGLVIGMYILGVTTLSCAYIGHNINHLDILPNYAGFLMGITNGIANLASISAPLFAGAVASHETDPSEWRIVFLVSAAVFIIGALQFIFLSASSVLEFNDLPKVSEKDRKKSSTSAVYLPV